MSNRLPLSAVSLDRGIVSKTIAQRGGRGGKNKKREEGRRRIGAMCSNLLLLCGMV